MADGEASSKRRVYEAMCHAVRRRLPRRHVPMLRLQWAVYVGDLVSRYVRRAVPFDSDALDRLLGVVSYDASPARQKLHWTPLALAEILAAARLLPSTATA
jgi:hypothetical protein